MKRKERLVVRLGALLLLSLSLGCAVSPRTPNECTPQVPNTACKPVGAVEDDFVKLLLTQRTYGYDKAVPVDLIQFARNANVPVNSADMKFIGSSEQGAHTALAVRIWLIENAQHTVDVMYYIFRDDFSGQAILGALCNAVRRGVDVRIMVDSLGSLSLKKDQLKALKSCEVEAGYLKNAAGKTTIHRARVQAAIFNALSKPGSKPNRRSHDKLIVVDGAFVGKSYGITGGRNISMDYFGILEDGSFNPHSYSDADLLVREPKAATDTEPYPLGRVMETYFSILFYFDKNRILRTSTNLDKYSTIRADHQRELETLKKLPDIQAALSSMPSFLASDFHAGRAVLAHEIANITNKNVIRSAPENLSRSQNSITAMMNQFGTEDFKKIRIVSPYLFSALYTNDNGEVIIDEAQKILAWLETHPQSTIEIITNSVLTSDNPFTQAIIDLDLAPRLLLSSDLRAQWEKRLSKSELNDELVLSERWKKLTNHPRLTIYTLGRLDAVEFGGDRHYGKLHAKYITADDVGFVGTSNFDYRSRLFNSEMGFFYESSELSDDINQNTDRLIEQSYRWGSPDWLELRKRLRAQKGRKAWLARQQRSLYLGLKKTGLWWLF